MNKQTDLNAAWDAAQVAATVAFLRTYAKAVGVTLPSLGNNPTFSAVQRASRTLGLRTSAVIAMAGGNLFMLDGEDE